MSYAKHYKEMNQKNGKIMDCHTYIMLVQMMLVRSSNYVFTNCRKHVFGDFVRPSEKFDLAVVLNNI